MCVSLWARFNNALFQPHTSIMVVFYKKRLVESWSDLDRDISYIYAKDP